MVRPALQDRRGWRGKGGGVQLKNLQASTRSKLTGLSLSACIREDRYSSFQPGIAKVGWLILQEAEDPGKTAISKVSCLDVCLSVLEGLGGEAEGEIVVKGMTSHSVSAEHDGDGGHCGGRPMSDASS